jgi:hypothetical protein
MYSYCNNDSLVMNRDTIKESTDTNLFSLSANGDTLVMIYTYLSYFYDSTFSIDSTIDTNKGILIRSGTGSNIQGTWTSPDTGYFDKGITFIISSNTITMYNDQSFCYADSYLEWAYLDTTFIAITTKKVSCELIQFTGNLTGETVTLSWDSNRNITYSSNVAAHTSGTVFENPMQCPNIPPDWYGRFIKGNIKHFTCKLAMQDYPTQPGKHRTHKTVSQEMFK